MFNCVTQRLSAEGGTTSSATLTATGKLERRRLTGEGNEALSGSSAMGFDYFCVLSAGLKTPTVISHNTARTAAANQPAAKTAPTANHLAKQASQYPLQRSGSARLSRVHSTGKGCVSALYVYVRLLSACVCWQSVCVQRAPGVSVFQKSINP